jgi:5S rRNA maturation endonuclease (ribonuclease M5)
MPVKKQKYKADTVRAAFSRYAVGEELDGEQRMFCPVCENPDTSQSPSASMNAEQGVWNCLKNSHGGSIYNLVKDLKDERGFDIRSEAMKGRHSNPEYKAAVQERLGNSNSAKNAPPLPDAEKIERWVQALIANKAKLKALQEARGLTRETIVDFELGWDGERYTIPVREADGTLVNVRRYKLGASSGQKMLNLPGHGAAHIYRADILAENETVVITEGEMDCILLNQEGIPAVTHTAGAATFRSQWAKDFRGKNVFVAYDADDAGRKGAKKVESLLAAFAASVHLIDMPETTKGADVTDYLHMEGHTASEFQELMSAAMDRSGVMKVTRPLITNGEHVSLNASMSQDNQAKTLELIVSVAGKQQEPNTAPKLINATCDMSKGAACELCPVAGKNGAMELEIRADDEQLFRFVDVPEQRRKALMKEITGARCSDRVEFEVAENYHIEELLVQPSVDDRKDDETQQPVRRTAYSIGTHETGVNSKVRLVGRNVPDPRNGKLKFMAHLNESVEMDIDKYELTPEIREKLMAFRPREGQSALSKCFDIADDMAENVTHIYGRDILHVAYDLVWHSVISFKVGDQTVQKGWLEAANVGDTRTGKSETAIALSRHYRSGVVQSCEGMSFPGLVGGVQQIDGRWHMTWGVVPMNDRRMVVLDEVSGLKDKDVIEQMSSIRSSGIAQVTKIASEETSARTRLIWIMNPGDGSMLKDNNNGGMGALRTVVPNAEDVARFDFVLATAKGDVDSKVINASFDEGHDPGYSSEISEALVKWAWSLTKDKVRISDAAAKQAIDSALDLGERYISDPPLIQSENVRFKLLRIAAAIAARTFSCDKSGNLVVNKGHVTDAVEFLDKIYEEKSMGYARLSRKHLAEEKQAQEKKHNVKQFLQQEDSVLLTLRMVGGNNFRTRDFVDFGGMDIAQAKAVVSTLLKWNVIKLKTRGDIGMGEVLINAIREIEEAADE